MQATVNARISSLFWKIYIKSTRSSSWLKFPLMVQSITERQVRGKRCLRLFLQLQTQDSNPIDMYCMVQCIGGVGQSSKLTFALFS